MATETTYRNVQQVEKNVYNLQLLKEKPQESWSLEKCLLKISIIAQIKWQWYWTKLGGVIILRVFSDECPTCQLSNFGKNTKVWHKQEPNSSGPFEYFPMGYNYLLVIIASQDGLGIFLAGELCSPLTEYPIISHQ